MVGSLFNEKVIPEESDAEEAFIALQAKLAVALNERQVELTQTACDVCSSLLLRGTRLAPCRHCICAICWESTGRYFSECPACSSPLNTSTTLDVEHERLMRSRLKGPQDRSGRTARLLTAWEKRFEAAVRERENSLRLVLEYGSVVDSTPVKEPESAPTAGIWGKLREMHKVVQKVFVYVRLPGVGAVHVGIEVTDGKQGDAISGYDLIEKVVLNPAPGFEPREGADCIVHAPNHNQLGYAFSSPTSRRFQIQIHWRADLGMVPLEIKYNLGSASNNTSLKRRIVIQLPHMLLNMKKERRASEPNRLAKESKEPAIFPNGGQHLDVPKSGWVLYNNDRTRPVMLTGGRSFGRGSSTLEMEEMCRMLSTIDLDEAGRVDEVIQMLVHAAAKGLPLEEAAKVLSEPEAKERDENGEEEETAPLSTSTQSSPQMLCPSGASPEATPSSPSRQSSPRMPRPSGGSRASPRAQGSSPRPPRSPMMPSTRGSTSTRASNNAEESEKDEASGFTKKKRKKDRAFLRTAVTGIANDEIRVVYQTLQKLLLSDPTLLCPVSEDGANSKLKKKGNQERPQGFFHVAIDLPGYGQTEGSTKMVRTEPRKLIADVIKALAKSHAFALIGASIGAGAIMAALVEQPMLASFVVLQDPFLYSEAGTFTGVVHPTLIVADRNNLGSPIGVSRQLGRVMSRSAFVEYSSKETPRFFQDRVGKMVLDMFVENNWRGMMKGYGHNHKLALLTKLCGGLNAWKTNTTKLVDDDRKRRAEVIATPSAESP